MTANASNTFHLTKTEFDIYASSPEGSIRHNLGYLFNFGNDVDVDRLRKAVEVFLTRHPYLNTQLLQDKDGNILKHIVQSPTDIEVTEIKSGSLGDITELSPFKLLDSRLYRIKIITAFENTYLYFEAHQIIFDEMSARIFIRDIDKLYKNEDVRPEKSDANSLSLQEEKRSKSHEYNSAKKFFAELLKGEDVPMLPICDSQPQTSDPFPERIHFSFKKTSLKDIRLFAHSIKVRTDTVLTGIMGFMLSKYTGSSTSVFASSFNSRQSEHYQSCGMFTRTVPVCCKIDESQNISDYLTLLDRQISQSRKNYIYHYSDLTADLKCSPQVLFIYHSKQIETFNGKEVQVSELPADISRMPLVFEFGSHGDDLYADVEFRMDLYTSPSVYRLLLSLDHFASEFLSRTRIGEIPPASESQLSVVEKFTQTDKPYDANQTVVSLLSNSIRKCSAKPAISFDGQTWTYREVDSITRKIALHIQNLKIRKGGIVSILIPRCEHMVIATLGVIRSGAAYHPLDPIYPADQLLGMIQEVGTKLLITDRMLFARLHGYDGPVLFLDEIPNLRNSISADLPYIAPDDLLAVIHTSQAKGSSRCVMLEHRNIVAFCLWYQSFYNLNADSHIAACSGFGSCGYIMDFFPALASGCCIHIPDDSTCEDSSALDHYFTENQVTHAYMSTREGRIFAQTSSSPHLKHLTLSGGPLDLFDPPKDFTLYHGYETTECPVISTASKVNKSVRRVPVGKSIDNIKAYVVDHSNRRLAIGMPGELWIAGPQVARGYLNDKKSNQDAFIPNPFSDKHGYQRIYKTGDIVRFLNDGTIEFLHHRNEEIIIQGSRVELPEIETLILKYPEISDVTVTVRHDESGKPFLAAYIVSKSVVDIQDLLKFITEKSTSNIVPASIVQIARIPLDTCGKVDKAALPIPKDNYPVIEAPQNELQRNIHLAVGDIAKNHAFGIQDNIFDIGINPTQLPQLILDIANTLHVTIRTKNIIDNPTVLMLEQYISSNQRLNDSKPPLNKSNDFPITSRQKKIYDICIKNPKSIDNQLSLLIKLHQDIKLPQLKAAIEDAIDNHPYIKIHLFKNDKGEIRAKRMDDAEIEIDITRMDKVKPTLDTIVTPFVLLENTLYRINIIQTSSNNYLYLDFHNILADLSSIRILLEDVRQSYHRSKIEHEFLSGFDLGVMENDLYDSKEIEQAKKWYDELLDGFENKNAIQNDTNNTDNNYKKIDITCNVSLYELNAFCKEKHITKRALLTAAFGLVLGKYQYLEDVVFISSSHERSDSRIIRSVGNLDSDFPVRCKINPEEKILDYISKTGDQIINNIANNILPLEEITKSHPVCTDIAFLYRDHTLNFDRIAGKASKCDMSGIEPSHFTLHIEAYETTSKLRMMCTYQTAAYNKETVKTIAESIDIAVSEFMQKNSIGRVDILSQEQKQIIVSFNKTDTELDDNTTVVGLIEKMVQKFPNKTAIIDSEGSITYQEHNIRCNQIAHALLEHDIQPEEKIGIIMPRTALAYAAHEGTIKAGASFVPIDPNYTKDIIQSILETLKLRFIITNKDIADSLSDTFKTAHVKPLIIDELLSHDDNSNPNIKINPNQLCYAICTLNASNKIRALMIEHHNLSNFIHNNRTNPTTKSICDSMTVSLALAPLTNDFSILEELLILTHGGTVAIASENEISTPSQIAQMMIKNKVDIITCTPAFLDKIANEPDFQLAFRRVKVINLYGESITESLYKKLRDLGIECTILNNYSIPECTFAPCVDVITDEHITIGKPITNTKILILDKQNHIMPIGFPGRVTILGECVGRGYCGDISQAENRFLKLQSRQGFRTFDVAKYNFDGKLEIVGKINSDEPDDINIPATAPNPLKTETKPKKKAVSTKETDIAKKDIRNSADPSPKESVKSKPNDDDDKQPQDTFAAETSPSQLPPPPPQKPFAADQDDSQLPPPPPQKPFAADQDDSQLPPPPPQKPFAADQDDSQLPPPPPQKPFAADQDDSQLPPPPPQKLPKLSLNKSTKSTPSHETSKSREIPKASSESAKDAQSSIPLISQKNDSKDWANLSSEKSLDSDIVLPTNKPDVELKPTLDAKSAEMPKQPNTPTASEANADNKVIKMPEVIYKPSINIQPSSPSTTTMPPAPPAPPKSQQSSMSLSRMLRTVSNIHQMLSFNTPQHLHEIKIEDIGDILLTGCSGILGNQILKVLLRNTMAQVYCLVKDDEEYRTIQAQLRSSQKDKSFNRELSDGRICPIKGNMTTPKLSDDIDRIQFNTVINCASFDIDNNTEDNSLEKVNSYGISNLINLCERTGSRLIHISTTDIAGHQNTNQHGRNISLHETDFYFGQDLPDAYLESMFKAEELVLTHIAQNNLDGKVIRISNLACNDRSRYSIHSSLIQNLKLYQSSGRFPIGRICSRTFLSSVESTSEAIIRLVMTPKQFTLFHAFNTHCIELGDIIDIMRDERRMHIETVPNDSTQSHDHDIIINDTSADFTIQVLHKLGFRWPMITHHQISDLIKSI